MMTMIVFKLSMPNVASWNGKWSGDGRCFARIYREKEVPKDVWNKSFYYRWDDGWCACVDVEKIPAKEARRIEKMSEGFRGYDWMIKSIIKHGKILIDKE